MKKSLLVIAFVDDYRTMQLFFGKIILLSHKHLKWHAFIPLDIHKYSIYNSSRNVSKC